MLLGPEPSLLNNLAWTLGELQHEDALRVAKQALQAAPGRADIADTAGWIYFRAGDADTARELLEQAVETDPGNLDYQMHLAEIVASLGDTDVARAILAQAASGASEEHRAEIALLQERIAGYN